MVNNYITKLSILNMLDNSYKLIKSLYIPQDCLQGAEFPGHILWDGQIPIKIKVFLPDGISVSEMYNVRYDGFTLDGNVIELFGFEVGGYVGFVFKSSKLDEHSVTKRIKFLFESEAYSIEEEREIYLFRPEIAVEHKPEFIEIKETNEGKIISDKIRVANKGDGTALLIINVPENSRIIKKRPEDFEEFFSNFWSDLEKRFDLLKNTYPEFEDILSEFIEIGRKSPSFDKENLSELKRLLEKLVEAFEENEDFLEDFGNSIVTAYLANLYVVTEISSFLEFIKSIASRKTLLLEPMAIFEIPKSDDELSVIITTTDLANNEYPPIQVSAKVKVVSSTPEDVVRVPIYDLFEFS